PFQLLSPEARRPARSNSAIADGSSKTQPLQGAPEEKHHQYGRLPLMFEPAPPGLGANFAFRARGKGYDCLLSPDQLLLAARAGRRARPAKGKGPKAATGDHVEPQGLLRLKLEGSNSAAPGRGEEPLQGRMNYFIGDDPSNWRTNVPTYGRVS